MRHPAARWIVLVIAVSVAAGLGYHAITLEQRGLADRRALVGATADARALQAALSDARRALAAMASPGQPAVSWSRQVGTAIDTARTRLASLTARPGGAELAAGAARLDQLVEAEKRLREYATGGRSLQASDLAFGEALPHLDAIDGQVADLVATMTATAEQATAAARQQQSMALAGALGTLALAALVLTPVRRDSIAHTAQPAVDDLAATTPSNELSLDLGRAQPQTHAPVAKASDAAAVAAPHVNLSRVAAVCGDLARLSDGASLASLLERMAPAVGAKGIVVWLADADRHALHVASSWGYDRRVVERFPSVPVNDDNPTARAFASGVVSVAPGRIGQPAAIATPIVGANGATGVLSLELTSSSPAPDVVAAAGIVAAQLATLLEPLPRADAPAPDALEAQQG